MNARTITRRTEAVSFLPMMLAAGVFEQSDRSFRAETDRAADRARNNVAQLQSRGLLPADARDGFDGKIVVMDESHATAANHVRKVDVVR